MVNLTVTITFACAILFAVLSTGCEEKFDLTDLPAAEQVTTIGDTSYVEIVPSWNYFESPRAIIVGNDQLLYVADYDRNEIVMMDAGGTVLQRRTILHPAAIAQNSKLDLYVSGEALASNGVDTVAAIYRIHLVRLDTSYLSRIDTVFNPTTNETTYTPVFRDTSIFYNHQLNAASMSVVWREEARPQRRFTGIGIMPGNQYVVARTGPDNSSFVDPDARVLLFNSDDVLLTPIGDLVSRPSGGSAITDINQLTGIFVLPGTRDFVITQKSVGVAYGAVWMMYINRVDFQGWLPQYDPAKPEQRGIDFIRSDRFKEATAVAYDRRRRDIFIVDAGLDSVIKFDRNGKFRNESFGKHRHDLKNPRGIAFSNDCTLYIADTGNKLIRRFKLSTQTICN